MVSEITHYGGINGEINSLSGSFKEVYFTISLDSLCAYS